MRNGLAPIPFLKAMEIFETHAHLLDTAFDPDRAGTVEEMRKAGVNYAVEACCKAEDIEKILAFCREYPFILPTAGVHPEEIDPQKNGSDLLSVSEAAQKNRLYAIGEIGLDYHFEDMCPAEVQKRYFDEQLSIAEQHDLPVIIHDRDAHGDCMDVLRAHKGRLRGIMHCFSGSWETARECLDLGLHLGFGGVITFKNAKKSRTVLQNMPADHIVFETDCPYMAPEPFRGQRNFPGYIPYIIETAAVVRNEDKEALAEAVYGNSLKLFGVG